MINLTTAQTVMLMLAQTQIQTQNTVAYYAKKVTVERSH